MDKAAEQALRAGQIIRRLREFVARGEGERRVESVKKLVEEASALALVGAKDQGVRVRFQFDPTIDLILADKDGMLAISVADTGSGISPDIASHLFQPFITNKRHGMGVGLSICRTIVEAHGGQIGANSNPAGGTTFRFTLRAVSQEEVRDAV